MALLSPTTSHSFSTTPMANNIRLTPFRGVNNVEDENSPAFSPGEQPAYVREAVNVDFTRQGLIKKRKGLHKVLSLTDGKSVFAHGSQIYFMDDGSLKQVSVANITQGSETEATATTLASGLGPTPMSFAAFGGDVYFCNKTSRGRIRAGSVLPWGIVAPAPATLSTTTGNLFAGDYMVGLTAELADGSESGCSVSSKVTITEGAGITVSNILLDPNAAFVNVFLTEVNGSVLYWHAKFAAADVIGGVINIRNPASTRYVCRTLQLFEPPPESYIVKSFQGLLLVASGSSIFWNQAQMPHLFKWSTDVVTFESAPKFIATVADGFYVGEGDRTWFVGGTDPTQWTRTLVDVSPPIQCKPIEVRGTKIPMLQTPAMCSLWLTNDGVVAGQPSGITQHLTEDRVAMSSGESGSLVLKEMEGISQVLASFRKTSSNQFKVTDRAIIEVEYV